MQWNNIVTAPEHFNSRQPQDLVRGVKDDQSVPVPRPRQTNQFTIVESYVTAPAAAGSTSLVVASVAGFNIGDSCQVILDSGVPFPFTVATVSGNTLGWAGSGLPYSVGTLYGSPIENAVTDLSSALIPVNEKPVPAY